jgi:membrane protease YdiL (CAAX protease family)
MHAQLEPRATPRNRSVTADVWMYLTLAFLFSWVAWILVIKLHAREEFLNFGTVGPAFAAILLSRRQTASSRPWLRVVTFLVLLVLGWIVLSWHYSWRDSPDRSFGLNPWLIAPALFPAWIISGVFSKDSGVSGFLKRLVHAPGRYSLLALLFFPALLLIPAWIAHRFHQPLIVPELEGSAAASVAPAAVFFLYNIFFVAVLEEPGWRGFLLDRLQQRWSPLMASLLVWLPWALWHAPLDYFRPVRFSPSVYLQLRVAFLIPIVIILTWLYNRSGRSIQATAIFHASMNTFPFILPYFTPGLGLLFVVAVYAVISDRMWRRHGSGLAIAGADGAASPS